MSESRGTPTQKGFLENWIYRQQVLPDTQWPWQPGRAESSGTPLAELLPFLFPQPIGAKHVTPPPWPGWWPQTDPKFLVFAAGVTLTSGTLLPDISWSQLAWQTNVLGQLVATLPGPPATPIPIGQALIPVFGSAGISWISESRGTPTQRGFLESWIYRSLVTPDVKWPFLWGPADSRGVLLSTLPGGLTPVFGLSAPVPQWPWQPGRAESAGNFTALTTGPIPIGRGYGPYVGWAPFRIQLGDPQVNALVLAFVAPPLPIGQGFIPVFGSAGTSWISESRGTGTGRGFLDSWIYRSFVMPGVMWPFLWTPADSRGTPTQRGFLENWIYRSLVAPDPQWIQPWQTGANAGVSLFVLLPPVAGLVVADAIMAVEALGRQQADNNALAEWLSTEIADQAAAQADVLASRSAGLSQLEWVATTRADPAAPLEAGVRMAIDTALAVEAGLAARGDAGVTLEMMGSIGQRMTSDIVVPLAWIRKRVRVTRLLPSRLLRSGDE